MSVIYALCDPESGAVRYVGKTAGTPEGRLAQHVRRAREGSRWHVSNWLRSIGCEPAVVILERDPEDANEAERRWIAHHRAAGADLTNATDGGDGGDTGGRTGPHTAETKAKISAALAGRKLTPEHRVNIARGQSGLKKRSGPAISAAKMGHVVTTETRKKISASLKGRPNPHNAAWNEAVRAARWSTGIIDEVPTKEVMPCQ